MAHALPRAPQSNRANLSLIGVVQIVFRSINALREKSHRTTNGFAQRLLAIDLKTNSYFEALLGSFGLPTQPDTTAVSFHNVPRKGFYVCLTSIVDC